MFKSIAIKPYRTKEEYVYEIVRAAIMDGTLRPGEKLVIDNMREELGVSTIPIRTALQRLEVEGFVDIQPHTGAVVSNITLDDVAEIFALLQTLESLAFGTASQKATEKDIELIAGIVAEMDEAVRNQDPDTWAVLNSRFHLAIAHLSQMPLLEEFTARVLDRWDRLRSLYLRPYILSRMTVAQQDHQRMLELLRERNSIGLSALAEAHNLRAYEAFREYTARLSRYEEA